MTDSRNDVLEKDDKDKYKTMNQDMLDEIINDPELEAIHDAVLNPGKGKVLEAAQSRAKEIIFENQVRAALVGEKMATDKYILEVSSRLNLHMLLPKITGNSTMECTLGDKNFVLSPGLYCIVGTMESGKSTLLDSLAEGKGSTFLVNESFVGNAKSVSANNFSVVDNILEMQSYLSERFTRGEIAFLDSLRCVLSINDAGYAKGGVPIGSFDFIDNLDKYCVRHGQIVIAVLPVDEDSMEIRERYYSMVGIRCSGAFMPFASQNALSVRIRYDLKTQSRISRFQTQLFDIRNNDSFKI